MEEALLCFTWKEDKKKEDANSSFRKAALSFPQDLHLQKRKSLEER